MIGALQTATSAIILWWYLTILFFLSLIHNIVEVHLRGHPDKRDVRSSKFKITPDKNAPKKKHHKSRGSYPNRIKRVSGSNGHHRADSISSITPLDIEDDEVNNIEYDYTITNLKARPKFNSSDNTKLSRPQQVVDTSEPHSIGENPYQRDVLELEETRLVPDLKYYYRQYGIDIEEFRIKTDDGFVIDLWHLVPLNRETGSDINTATTTTTKYPILMVHGLLQSAGAFASTGRKSLAYYLHVSGFDVWLGNNRCGFHPEWDMDMLQHDKRQRWNWDIKEMARYDLKALVSTVLEKTGFAKLTLVGHSQGTTQSLYALVNGEELYDNDESGFKLVDKLDNFIALAPAIYPGPLLWEKLFVRLMAFGIDSPWIFGYKSFIPLMMQMRSIGVGHRIFSFFSYIMFNYLFDWDDSLWDKKLRNRNFLFSPVNISVKLMRWWLSSDPKVVSFKHGAGKMFPDEKTWFPLINDSSDSDSDSQSHSASTPNNGSSTHSEGATGEETKQEIHLNQPRARYTDFPQLMFFVPGQDRLVNCERLINHFINYEDNGVYKIWYISEQSHMDVLWAHDVIERIGKPMVENLRIPQGDILVV